MSIPDQSSPLLPVLRQSLDLSPCPSLTRDLPMSIPDQSSPLLSVRRQSFYLSPCPSLTRALHCCLSWDSRWICPHVHPWPELSTAFCPEAIGGSAPMSIPDQSSTLLPVLRQSVDLSPCPSLTRAPHCCLSWDNRWICPHVHPWPELYIAVCPETIGVSVPMSITDQSSTLLPVLRQSVDMSPCPSLTRVIHCRLSWNNRWICTHVHPWLFITLCYPTPCLWIFLFSVCLMESISLQLLRWSVVAFPRHLHLRSLISVEIGWVFVYGTALHYWWSFARWCIIYRVLQRHLVWKTSTSIRLMIVIIGFYDTAPQRTP